MEGQNILNTIFFNIVNTGNNIELELPNPIPKKIKIFMTATNLALTTIPVYIEFLGHKIYAYESYGVAQAITQNKYEFTNNMYINPNHFLFVKNANTHDLLNQGYITLVINFIY